MRIENRRLYRGESRRFFSFCKNEFGVGSLILHGMGQRFAVYWTAKSTQDKT